MLVPSGRLRRRRLLLLLLTIWRALLRQLMRGVRGLRRDGRLLQLRRLSRHGAGRTGGTGRRAVSLAWRRWSPVYRLVPVVLLIRRLVRLLRLLGIVHDHARGRGVTHLGHALRWHLVAIGGRRALGVRLLSAGARRVVDVATGGRGARRQLAHGGRSLAVLGVYLARGGVVILRVLAEEGDGVPVAEAVLEPETQSLSEADLLPLLFQRYLGLNIAGRALPGEAEDGQEEEDPHDGTEAEGELSNHHAAEPEVVLQEAEEEDGRQHRSQDDCVDEDIAAKVVVVVAARESAAATAAAAAASRIAAARATGAKVG